MGELQIYKVRPWPAGIDFKDVFRVFLSPSSLLLHKLSPDDVCNIHTTEGSRYPAVAWPSSGGLEKGVMQTSKDLQKAYGLKLGTKVSINPSDAVVEDARDVVLCEISQGESVNSPSSLDEKGRVHWAWLLEYSLKMKQKIVPHQLLSVNAKGEERTFRILNINASNDLSLYHTQIIGSVNIVDDKGLGKSGEQNTLVIPTSELGGLDHQIQQLNDLVAIYSARNHSRSNMPSFFQPFQGGILLYGARGTGKTTVLQNICEARWRKVYHIDSTVIGQRAAEIEAAIKRVFSEALRLQPSVIIIDSIDTIAGRSSTTGPVLSRELEGLRNTRTIAIGATRNLSDIDQDLRSAGRFETEIELPIPDSNSRAEILKVLCDLPKNTSHATLDNIARRTHGYVGADLKKLLGYAVRTNEIHHRASRLSDGKNGGHDVRPETLLNNMKPDFEMALLKVRPTAMQEIFVEIPKVRWSDIGGQYELKRRLEQAVVWPFKVRAKRNNPRSHNNDILQYSNEMKDLGLTPKKGLLLYGPPGCSKTMTAKAAATESGLNFIAVRGAELLSMFVGESERAIREVFSKARAASPCIIFFDEFDAIGASRDSCQQGGIHTVTTLLNELDGFEELKGVFVLAATNKPEVIDPALIRAGRLSETLYVGMPDLDARKSILDMQTSSMNLADDVDTEALSDTIDGYSGAEIVAICQQARYAAFEEQITYGERKQISQKHFSIAMAKVEKSVTLEMTRRYEAWGTGRHG